MIDRRLYPGLDSILWDTKLIFIDEDYAFKMYEKRFSYIKYSLSENDKILLSILTDSIGKGFFLPNI